MKHWTADTIISSQEEHHNDQSRHLISDIWYPDIMDGISSYLINISCQSHPDGCSYGGHIYCTNPLGNRRNGLKRNSPRQRSLARPFQYGSNFVDTCPYALRLVLRTVVFLMNGSFETTKWSIHQVDVISPLELSISDTSKLSLSGVEVLSIYSYHPSITSTSSRLLLRRA